MLFEMINKSSNFWATTQTSGRTGSLSTFSRTGGSCSRPQQPTRKIYLTQSKTNSDSVDTSKPTNP